jgi:hypothetical protein
MNGKGIYTWPDGRSYDGYFENDMKHGLGIYSWPDGKCYDGGWKDGKQHGQGKFTNSRGKTKVGMWEDGEKIKWLSRDEVTENGETDPPQTIQKFSSDVLDDVKIDE